ncbi:MAG: hypothetical protein H7199_01275 [Burkholderiales bacterium]|nr:hypothetical protein [Flavobacterium sp.]
MKKYKSDQKIVFDYFSVKRLKIEEAGDCDLDGLFIRLNHAIDVVTAERGSWQHRITISCLDNQASLRANFIDFFGG